MMVKNKTKQSLNELSPVEIWLKGIVVHFGVPHEYDNLYSERIQLKLPFKKCWVSTEIQANHVETLVRNFLH